MLYGRSLIAPGATVFYAYAKGSDEYLFVPQEHAQHLSDVYRALLLSRTWGEFWATLPASEAMRLKASLAGRAAGEEPEDAQRFAPSDDGPFDPLVLPGVEDGDYPEQPSWLALDWFPRGLIEDLGGVTGGPGSGLFLRVEGDGGPLPGVEETFARHGYRLVWDEERVLKASGWWWDEVSLGRRPG